MFKFENDDSLQRIKEFGTDKWIKNNMYLIAAMMVAYFSLGYLTYDSLFAKASTAIAILPVLSLLALPSLRFLKIAIVIQCSWYIPVLFYKARDRSL